MVFSLWYPHQQVGVRYRVAFPVGLMVQFWCKYHRNNGLYWLGGRPEPNFGDCVDTLDTVLPHRQLYTAAIGCMVRRLASRSLLSSQD